MAVTDYIFQEETVEKRNFGAWLVAKMVAAGWQQVGSNPPTALTDASSKFYMMKTKRDADNAEAYVGINDMYLRGSGATFTTTIFVDLFTDYTPGAAGATGTSSRTFTRIVSPGTSAISSFSIAGGNGTNTNIPVDTLLSIRFCITKTHVTVIVRPPSTTGLLAQLLFFGLPEFLQKEKVAGGTVLFGTGSIGTTNDSPFVCDSTPGTSSTANMVEALGRWMDPQKSPDAAGNFPLMPGFVGNTDTGLRHRFPSFFFLKSGGVLDRDIIQVSGMNFEIVTTHSTTGTDFGSNNTFAYRIS